MKILITGGHLTPALAVIDYIQSSHPDDEILYCSRYYSQYRLKQLSIEKQEIDLRGIPYLIIPNPPRLNSIIKFWLWPSIVWNLIKSTKATGKLLQKYQPDAILSFGSYVAIPICIAAKLKKITIVTHEQTLVVGLSNQIIAKLADIVATGFKQTKKNFSQSKAVYVGNPLRMNRKDLKLKKPKWFVSEKNKPILLFLGGNQGSLFLNTFVKNNLEEMLNEYIVVHACGKATKEHDYYSELTHHSRHIIGDKRKNYYCHEWISKEDLQWIYQNTFVCISRSGANTVLELTEMQVPAIYVPLPHSRYSEQTLNANWAVKQKAALMVNQADFDYGTFQISMDKINEDYKKIKKNLEKIDLPDNSAERIYKLLSRSIRSYEKKKKAS